MDRTVWVDCPVPPEFERPTGLHDGAMLRIQCAYILWDRDRSLALGVGVEGLPEQQIYLKVIGAATCAAPPQLQLVVPTSSEDTDRGTMPSICSFQVD